MSSDHNQIYRGRSFVNTAWLKCTLGTPDDRKAFLEACRRFRALEICEHDVHYPARHKAVAAELRALDAYPAAQLADAGFGRLSESARARLSEDLRVLRGRRLDEDCLPRIRVLDEKHVAALRAELHKIGQEDQREDYKRWCIPHEHSELFECVRTSLYAMEEFLSIPRSPFTGAEPEYILSEWFTTPIPANLYIAPAA